MIFFHISLFAQENINCIVMIDGKLLTNDLKCYIEYVDNIQNSKKIGIDCHTPGILVINDEDISLLRNLPISTKIEIHFEFTEFRKGIKHATYHYNHFFTIGDLINHNYIVFSITNINKRKKTYYFDYAIDNMRRTWKKEWKKEYKKKHRIFYNEYYG